MKVKRGLQRFQVEVKDPITYSRIIGRLAGIGCFMSSSRTNVPDPFDPETYHGGDKTAYVKVNWNGAMLIRTIPFSQLDSQLFPSRTAESVIDDPYPKYDGFTHMSILARSVFTTVSVQEALILAGYTWNPIPGRSWSDVEPVKAGSTFYTDTNGIISLSEVPGTSYMKVGSSEIVELLSVGGKRLLSNKERSVAIAKARVLNGPTSSTVFKKKGWAALPPLEKPAPARALPEPMKMLPAPAAMFESIKVWSPGPDSVPVLPSPVIPAQGNGGLGEGDPSFRPGRGERIKVWRPGSKVKTSAIFSVYIDGATSPYACVKQGHEAFFDVGVRHQTVLWEHAGPFIEVPEYTIPVIEAMMKCKVVSGDGFEIYKGTLND